MKKNSIFHIIIQKRFYSIKRNFTSIFLFIILLKKNHLYFIKILIIIFFNWNNIIFVKILNFYINHNIEVEKIEYQLNYYNNLKSNKIKVYKKIKNPKISIISPIYNRQSYLKKFLRNMEFQSFQGIEIILVNDCSMDNFEKIIEKYISKDKRIIILNNKKRKGTFIARNLGVLFAKGKYVNIPDPDDIISKNILSICYKYAEKYKYDIIKFRVKKTENEQVNLKNLKNLINGLGDIQQPRLSTYIFYFNYEIKKREFYIWNKFIKKEIYIKSLNSLNKFYFNMYVSYMEDQIMNYILYRNAKSLYYINNIGYYYILNSMSICKRKLNTEKITIFKFIYLKIIFEYSKNTKFEKDISNFLGTSLLKHIKLSSNYSNLALLYDIINIYLNSKYISKNNKNLLLKIKNNLKKNN